MLVVISQLIEKKRSMDKGRDVSGVKKKTQQQKIICWNTVSSVKDIAFQN